jgi:hypothetical protein
MVLSVELGGWRIVAAHRTCRPSRTSSREKSDIHAPYEFTGEASHEKFVENIKTARNARRANGLFFELRATAYGVSNVKLLADITCDETGGGGPTPPVSPSSRGR